VADLERAEVLIAEVLAVSPRDSIAHFAKAQVLRAQNRFDEAIPEYEIAVALNRNWVIAIAALGQCKFLSGAIEEAIPAQEQATASAHAIPGLQIGTSALAKRTCCNRGSMRRSSGSKRRAAPIRDFQALTDSSLRPMPSKARPNGPPPSLPKPEGSYLSLAGMRRGTRYETPVIRALAEKPSMMACAKRVCRRNEGCLPLPPRGRGS
jgi:tetratricopeptide (TPR) repeat protein